MLRIQNITITVSIETNKHDVTTTYDLDTYGSIGELLDAVSADIATETESEDAIAALREKVDDLENWAMEMRDRL